jgi:hypothetical protein
MQRISPMGCHRALTAMDLAEAARRRKTATTAHNDRIKRAAKIATLNTLQGLRELRAIIGEDGYRLP